MKKKGNIFLRLLLVLFIIYSFLFLAEQTGYYQKSIRDRTIMTEMQRKKFEQDIANNNAINVGDYLPKKKDYANFFTKSANKIANALGDVTDDKMISFWHFFKALFAR